MALIDHVEGDFYKTAFDDWEATEQIFDDNHALWMIKKPGSEYQKVCLYRDGHFLCVYGDYGTMTFNQMTWKGSVYNLEYDNIGYQMEKLSYESKESLCVYGDILQDEDSKYYTTGVNRTGCIFCGFGCHLQKEPNKFQQLKLTHPALWEYCMKPWDKGGLGMKKVLDFIEVKID